LNAAAPARAGKLDLALVLALNALPLWGVIAGEWGIGALMVLFWLENVFAGAYQALRMVMLRGEGVIRAMKFLAVPFFVVHYGLFTAVHGLFVFTMLVPAGEPVAAEAAFGWAVLAALVVQGWQAWQAHVAYVPQALDAVQRQAGHADPGTARAQVRPLVQLMVEPYPRVGVLHVVIVLGGLASAMLGTPLASLVLLVLLKTGLELAQASGAMARLVASAK
jgi:hypothetical protein